MSYTSVTSNDYIVKKWLPLKARHPHKSHQSGHKILKTGKHLTGLDMPTLCDLVVSTLQNRRLTMYETIGN